MREEFQKLRLDRAEMLRRRQCYIQEYARLIVKLKFRERIVRELLRKPGEHAVDVEAAAEMVVKLRHRMSKQGWKPRGKDLRVVGQIQLVDQIQEQIDNAQVLYFAFQFGVQARAVVHIQKIWRACICRPPFREMVRESRLSLGYVFFVVHRLPALQPKLRRRIEKHKHNLFIRRRKASFVISVSMKRHLRIMKTLRWTHTYLDGRIVEHKRRVATAGYLQRWWKQYLEAAAIKKKALAYSAHLRAQEAERQRSAEEQRQHEASKVLQEWSSHIMIKKHAYASRVFVSLHQKLRDAIGRIDLRDSWQSKQLLGNLIDKDVERQVQRHLRHVQMLGRVVKTRRDKSRAKGHARIEQEGYVPIGVPGDDNESIVLDANEFEKAEHEDIPPTVLPYTGLFPNLDPDRVLNGSELCGPTWNFWKGIERLNKQLWVPELLREDTELRGMAESFIRWYIGESNPIVMESGANLCLSDHRYLTSLKALYKFNSVSKKASSGAQKGVSHSTNTLNEFNWFPPEMLCPKCFIFLSGSRSPEGYCTRCGLPPHYTRTDRYSSKLGNRYHLTTSGKSIRIDVDLFIIHVTFRSISLRAHYAGRTGSVPLFDAWVQALEEAGPTIAKLHQYGCTKLDKLYEVPLASIGIPGRTVLLIKSILWHVDEVLKWVRAQSLYEMTMHPTPKILLESRGLEDKRSKTRKLRKGRKKNRSKGSKNEKVKKMKRRGGGLPPVQQASAKYSSALAGQISLKLKYRRPQTAPSYRIKI